MSYLVLKLHAKLNKVLEYFKYNENDPYEGFKILEQFVFSQYLFSSGSIDDYLRGKRLIKRKFVIFILQLCTWTFALKSLFISYYKTKKFSEMTGDFSYLHPRPDILNVFVFLILIDIGIIGKP